MSIKHAVLGLLIEGEKSGYDLVREFDYRRSVVWPAPQNEIYRELAKLHEAGWIKPRGSSAAATPRGRKLYTVTVAGRKELRRWLLADDVNHSFRYEPVLRAVFLTQLAPAEARVRIERDLEFFERALAELRRSDDPAQPDFQPQLRADRRYARPLVIAFYEGLVHWSKQCLRELARAERRPDRPS